MQFTITYRSRFGAKFAFVESDSADGAGSRVLADNPGATILTVRENDPPLRIIAEVKK